MLLIIIYSWKRTEKEYDFRSGVGIITLDFLIIIILINLTVTSIDNNNNYYFFY